MKILRVKGIAKYSFLIIMFLFISTFSAFAAGEGVPFSNGVKPLSFVSCSLEDGNKIDNGEEITTLQPKFTLQFDKNVVNILVWERNKKCISLYTDNNQNVLIDVSKIDDTVDFDHRQQIFVQPINSLEPGKNYYLKVSPDLIAKNKVSTLGGTTNGKGITISFKTKKQEGVSPVVNSSQGTSSDITKQQNGVSTAADSSGEAEKNTKKAAVETGAEQNNAAADSSGEAEKKTKKTADETGAEQNNTAADSPETKTEGSNTQDNSSTNGTSDANNEANNEEQKTSEQASLLGSKNYNGWLSLAIVLIIIFWITIEVNIKRKKEGSSLE